MGPIVAGSHQGCIHWNQAGGCKPQCCPQVRQPGKGLQTVVCCRRVLVHPGLFVCAWRLVTDRLAGWLVGWRPDQLDELTWVGFVLTTSKFIS